MLDDTYNRTAKRMRDWIYSAFRIKFSASDLRQLDFNYTVKSPINVRAVSDARFHELPM